MTKNKISVSLLVFGVVLVLVLLTRGIWSAGPSEVHSAPQTQVQLADYQIPANGYVSGGRCYLVIGQGGFSQQVDCSTFHKLPAKVRQCVGAVASTMGIGWLYELEQMVAAFLASASGGCTPW